MQQFTLEDVNCMQNQNVLNTIKANEKNEKET